jgi:hypothetical protein
MARRSRSTRRRWRRCGRGSPPPCTSTSRTSCASTTSSRRPSPRSTSGGIGVSFQFWCGLVDLGSGKETATALVRLLEFGNELGPDLCSNGPQAEGDGRDYMSLLAFLS